MQCLRFFGEVFSSFRVCFWRDEFFLQEMFIIGVHSVLTVLVIGFFVGAIMAVQMSAQLDNFGALGWLGGMATSVTLRNVGPVLIAFLLSGKVGAYTTAELASMRLTHQLDAIASLGRSPISMIIAPRFLAVVLSSFILLMLGLVTSLLGGMVFAMLKLQVEPTYYMGQIPRFLSPYSFAISMMKSLVFGFIIAFVSCYRGYYASSSTEGIGNAVRRTSVESILCILVADYILSVFLNILGVRLGWLKLSLS